MKLNIYLFLRDLFGQNGADFVIYSCYRALHAKGISIVMISPVVPIARLGLQFDRKELRLNVYIKCFLNLPPKIGPRQMECFAKVIVLKQVKKNWMFARRPTICVEDVSKDRCVEMETLTVPRHCVPIFNEFFSCHLSEQYFNSCALRIQFGHVSRFGQRNIVAETDYWINEKPIDKFCEIDIPLRLCTPDLGEAEIGLCYLPTAERLQVTIVQATNLKLFGTTPGSSKTVAEIHLLVNGRTREKQRTSEREGCDPQFNNQFTFELERCELLRSALVITLIELISQSNYEDKNVNKSEIEGSSKQRKMEIGRVALAGGVRGVDHTHWTRMLLAPRERHTEVHKICPC